MLIPVSSCWGTRKQKDKAGMLFKMRIKKQNTIIGNLINQYSIYNKNREQTTWMFKERHCTNSWKGICSFWILKATSPGCNLPLAQCQLAYFSKTMLNRIPHLFQQHGFVIEETWCRNGLPVVQTFRQTEQVARHETQDMTNKTQDCWAAIIPPQTTMGHHSSPKGPVTGLLSSQMFTDCW